MRILLPFAIASTLLVLGCSASSINTKVAEAGPYAPANEQQSDGEVSYLNAGVKAVRDARRADAYEKMHNHCRGAYEIVKEEEQRGPMGPQRRIWFKCVKGESPSDAGSSS